MSEQEVKTEGSNEKDGLSPVKVIPMFRIFDKNKAIEFYVNWLGFPVRHSLCLRRVWWQIS